MWPPEGIITFLPFPLTPYSIIWQYLLLCQLLLESLAVADRHSLYFLLPLPRLSEPADEPLVAPAVGVHVSPEEVELPLPQIDLSEHSLPALQEAVDQLTIMLQLGITFAVDPRHLVVDGCCPAQLVLQTVKYHLVGLCFSTHWLSGKRAKSSAEHSSSRLIIQNIKQNTDCRYEWIVFSKERKYLQQITMVLHLLLFSWHFGNITQTGLIILQCVFWLFSVSDHNIDGLQPEIKQIYTLQKAQQQLEVHQGFSGESQSLTCPGRRRTGRRRGPSSWAWRPVRSAVSGRSWTAEETPEPPQSSLWGSSSHSLSSPTRTGLSVIGKSAKMVLWPSWPICANIVIILAVKSNKVSGICNTLIRIIPFPSAPDFVLFVHVLNVSFSFLYRYHLLGSLQGAGFEGLPVHRLSEARYCSILAALQPQTKVLNLRQVSLACWLIQVSWLDWKKAYLL